jgi:hypothetical protein
MRKQDWTYRPPTGTQLLEQNAVHEDLEFGKMRWQAFVVFAAACLVLVLGSVGGLLIVIHWVLP